MVFQAPRILAIVICVIVLSASGYALIQRLTRSWHWAHDIQGFVAYGAHEDLFSPDASQIAIAFQDQCKVIDLTSGMEICRLEKYAGKGLADFSSDGKIISRFPREKEADQAAELWNAANGKSLGRINAPEDWDFQQCTPVFSPDGSRIAVIYSQGLVLWDSSNLKQLDHIKITWPTNEWLPGLLAWNPKSQDLTVVDSDGKLLRIAQAQKSAVPLLANQQRAVKSACWSPDGTKLLTIDREDGSILVWNVQSGQALSTLKVEGEGYAYFSPDSQQLVTSTPRLDVVRTSRPAPRIWDRATSIRDATTGELIRDLPTTGIVKFSPDWKFIVESGPDGLRISRADGSAPSYYPYWFDGHGSTSVFAADNSYLASVNGSGRLAIWRHLDPAQRWIACLTSYELWVALLAMVALARTLVGSKKKSAVV